MYRKFLKDLGISNNFPEMSRYVLEKFDYLVENSREFLEISRNFLENSRKIVEISKIFLENSRNCLDISMKFQDFSRNVLDISMKFLEFSRKFLEISTGLRKLKTTSVNKIFRVPKYCLISPKTSQKSSQNPSPGSPKKANVARNAIFSTFLDFR